MLKYFYWFAPNTRCTLVFALSNKKKVSFSMDIENEELMHDSFPKTLAHGNSKN